MRFINLISIAAALSISWVAPSVAQDGTIFLEPPREEIGTTYTELVDPLGVETQTRYVEQTDQDWLKSDPPDLRVNIKPRGILDGLNGLSLVVVIGAIVLLLFLFLKYGGGGGLLSGDPSSGGPRRKRKKAWGLTASEESADSILAQVKAMKDRREALILLLRHCLLQAADETDTNFRRSDTEREALARLPQNWRRYAQLGHLLHQTELVHYGGREITDDNYALALRNGSEILTVGQSYA